MNCKIKTLKLDKDYQIEMKFLKSTKIIELKSGEKINIWKHFLFDLPEMLSILNRSELKILNLQIDKSYSYGLVICRANN
jgi:hypothetical protein